MYQKSLLFFETLKILKVQTQTSRQLLKTRPAEKIVYLFERRKEDMFFYSLSIMTRLFLRVGFWKIWFADDKEHQLVEGNVAAEDRRRGGGAAEWRSRGREREYVRHWSNWYFF